MVERVHGIRNLVLSLITPAQVSSSGTPREKATISCEERGKNARGVAASATTNVSIASRNGCIVTSNEG